MVKYYKLDTKEIINTRNEIPKSFWVKKNILPYVLKYVDVEKGTTTTIKEGIKINKIDVVETKINWIYIPTLAEYKEIKYNEIKSIGSSFIFSKYSLAQQTSALAGFYSVDENKVILDFAKLNFDKIRTLGVSIRASKTKVEVNTFKWVS